MESLKPVAPPQNQNSWRLPSAIKLPSLFNDYNYRLHKLMCHATSSVNAIFWSMNIDRGWLPRSQLVINRLVLETTFGVVFPESPEEKIARLTAKLKDLPAIDPAKGESYDA